MSARLVPLNPAVPSAPVIQLQRPVALIGRHPECDIRINSPQVSRRHCCLAQAYDRVLIRDLGSRHGVLVNGRAIDEVTLKPGDEIAIAQFIYRFEVVADASPPMLPQPRAAASSNPVPSHPIPIDDLDELIPLDD